MRIELLVPGCVLFVAGICLLIPGLLVRRRLLEIKETPLVEVEKACRRAEESESALVEIAGLTEAEQWLVSPASRTACVYYRHLVEERRTGEGAPSVKWRTVSDREKHLPFVVEDVSGRVTVVPDGAEFVARPVISDVGGTGGYRVSEWVVPVEEEIYVMGTAAPGSEGVEIRAGDGPFIISSRHEKEPARGIYYKPGLFLGPALLLGIIGAVLVIVSFI